MANTDSVYFSSWAKVAQIADGLLSNHFMHSKLVTHLQRKILLQLRTGTLPTNKMFHRINPAHTPNCPLCGQLDGGQHAISSCPALLGTISMLRHHAAGRKILKAISTGGHGASLVMGDVGNQERMAQEGLHLPTALPAWVLPPGYKPTSRPDGLLVLKRGPDGHVRRGSEILLVEIKYCADHMPSEQTAAAHSQHADLVKALKQHWKCRVAIVPLLLGVGGTIFTTFKQGMDELGVTGSQLETLARTLNCHTAEYAAKAMAFRCSNMAVTSMDSHSSFSRRRKTTIRAGSALLVLPLLHEQKQLACLNCPPWHPCCGWGEVGSELNNCCGGAPALGRDHKCAVNLSTWHTRLVATCLPGRPCDATERLAGHPSSHAGGGDGVPCTW